MGYGLLISAMIIAAIGPGIAARRVYRQSPPDQPKAHAIIVSCVAFVLQYAVVLGVFGVIAFVGFLVTFQR